MKLLGDGGLWDPTIAIIAPNPPVFSRRVSGWSLAFSEQLPDLSQEMVVRYLNRTWFPSGSHGALTNSWFRVQAHYFDSMFTAVSAFAAVGLIVIVYVLLKRLTRPSLSNIRGPKSSSFVYGKTRPFLFTPLIADVL